MCSHYEFACIIIPKVKYYKNNNKNSHTYKILNSKFIDMSLSDWLIAKRNLQASSNLTTDEVKIPEGLWIKCDKCGLLMYNKALNRNYKVCPQCQHHFPTSSQERIEQILDTQTWQPINDKLASI